MCRSGDKIHPEDWGGRITELFPEYVGLPAVTEPPIGGEGQPQRNNPMWIRVYLRHDKIANAVSTPLKASLVMASLVMASLLFWSVPPIFSHPLQRLRSICSGGLAQVGFRFREFDETLREMIVSLRDVGGVGYNSAAPKRS